MVAYSHLLSLADDTDTALTGRRTWLGRDGNHILTPFGWGAVEAVGRRWLARRQPVIWRLFDTANADRTIRICGSIIRARTNRIAAEFLEEVGDRARRMAGIASAAKVVPLVLAEDGTTGGWPSVTEYVRAMGQSLYPGWVTTFRYGEGHEVPEGCCQHVGRIRIGGATRVVTLIASPPWL